VADALSRCTEEAMELAALAVPTFRMFEALRTQIEEVVAL
jgi:hypothetical protein